MRNLLGKIFKNKEPVPTGKLDFNRLRVMQASQLIEFTGQFNRLRHIKRIVQIDDDRYQTLYQDVIESFAELVQLMPASQAHHHAVPGGLFIHTLEVIEHALTLRQQYKLPLFATQEVQEAERHVWTYAIFVAAILHDVGKRLTMCHFILDDSTTLAPFTSKANQLMGRHYHIVFHDSKYHSLHEQIGLTFSGKLLPPLAQDFLFTRLHIMRELMSYIHSDDFNSGVIGQILRQADQRSTGSSLAHIQSRKFPGASMENIGERLMTQLRMLLASNHFTINKANANVYTTPDGYTYILSKILADELRNSINEEGKHDIPTDNNRIFDIFAEYGFAELNDKGQAMHYICRVTAEGKANTFTVLKFETRKLFRTLPPEFNGKIDEVPSKGSETTHENNFRPETENEIKKTSDKNSTTETGNHQSQNAVSGINPIVSPKPNPVAVANPNPAAVAKVTNTEPSQADQSPETDLAEAFLNWCREGIKTRDITINESSGMVQKVKYRDQEVIAVVTPRIFIEFGHQALGLPKAKSTAEKIQRSIHSRKLNIPAARGQVHQYKIQKSQNNPLGGHAKIWHYLFELDKFSGDDETVKKIIYQSNVNENLAQC